MTALLRGLFASWSRPENFKRKETEKTPVIFNTDISVPNLDVINKYHCSNYFSKPYSDADVIDAINKVTKAPEPKDKAIKLKDIFGIIIYPKTV